MDGAHGRALQSIAINESDGGAQMRAGKLPRLFMLIAVVAPSGCVSLQEAGTVAGSSAAGAVIGALGGAAVSEKGDGRRADGAVRGALGGAALGSAAGLGMLREQRAQQRIAARHATEQAARRRGSTRCQSTKRVTAEGQVIVTEECTSNVVRPGYQNF